MRQSSNGYSVKVTQKGGVVTIVLNGKTYQAKGSDVSLINRRVIIDGKEWSPGESEADFLDDKTLNISFDCDTNVNIVTEEPVTVLGGVNGDIKCGPLQCDNITGNVDVSGPISCDDIKGDVVAGGPVQCDDITGNLKAGGPVSCDSAGSMN